MSHVWTRASPDLGEDVGCPEGEQRAESRRRHSVSPVNRAPLAGNEEQDRQQGREGVLGVQREEAKRIFDEAIVCGGEVVDRLEERVVDQARVVALQRLRAVRETLKQK